MKEDTISRQVAIDALTEEKEMINAVLDSLTLDYNARRNQEQRRGQINEDIETIKALPPAQPKRIMGRWERWPGQLFPHNTIWWYVCSACGGKAIEGGVLTNFCPNCGAEMEGGQDDRI